MRAFAFVNASVPAWTYMTDIPHATFDVMDDGELYCRGIVFALADLTATA